MAVRDRDDAWRMRHSRLFYSPCYLPDFTNPDAVQWWKNKLIEHLKAGCFGIGMSDFGEDLPADACFHNGRSGLEVHNIYTLLYQKATFEAIEEGTDHRGLVNARSGTAGMQRFPICWSGDPNCSWQDMATNIRAGLNIGLSGVAFWSCDNGGFQAETGDLTPELWIRWTQWSMFLSHVRLHGGLPDRVPWHFGERATDIFRKYATLRFRLFPYIYSQAYLCTQTGLPLIRALVLEYQEDPLVCDIEDQYLFGDAFLVAPVYSQDNQRAVYLPEGTWFDYWTARSYEGPVSLKIEPPLEVLPLYVRGDSMIPMGPKMAYIGEKPLDPITLDIWLCSETECIVYDDDEMVMVRARRKADRTIIELSSSTKSYIVKLNKSGCPLRVKVNGVEAPSFRSYNDLEKSTRGWYFDPSLVTYIKWDALGARSEISVEV